MVLGAWLEAVERDLMVDPCFFQQLAELLPEISDVETLLRRGPAPNELTRYGYDVAMAISNPNALEQAAPETLRVVNRQVTQWGMALAVVKVGGNGDDRLGDFLA